MANIEKKHIIDSNKLSGEQYFASILQEAYSNGLLWDSEIENIQLQCIQFWHISVKGTVAVKAVP